MSVLGLPVCRVGELEDPEIGHRWLVEPLWTRAAVGFIGGVPKLGKTWLGLDIALSVATNTKCLGRYAVAEPGRALVYLAEDHPSVVRQRLQGLCRHRHLEIAGVDLHVITAPALRLDLERDRDRLTETVRRMKPKLVLLDPLIRLHRVDENSAGDVSGLLAYLRELQRASDIAIIVVPNADGTVTNTVSVVANETDANPADNTDTTVTTVASPPMGDDLTVEIDAAPITTTPTPKGPAYGTSGAISLANNGVVYGMADFTVDMMDATKPPKPGKPLKPKWAFNLQITNLTFDLGANPSARLNVYLSDDAVFDASDTALLKAGKEPTTAALDALAQVFKAPKLGAKVPKSTNLSGKFVLVVIDFDDQVDESNENNNAAALGPIP